MSFSFFIYFMIFVLIIVFITFAYVRHSDTINAKDIWNKLLKQTKEKPRTGLPGGVFLYMRLYGCRCATTNRGQSRHHNLGQSPVLPIARSSEPSSLICCFSPAWAN